MKRAKHILGRMLQSILGVALLGAALSSIGCTVHTNGMTLPSPNWLDQRVQYMPTGPQFIHSQEAALMDAAKAERK